MKEQGGALFRDAALRYRADRLHGAVSIATPMAWQAIGFLLLAVLIGTGAFLSLASYTRTQTVPGAVTLDTGVMAITASRPGLVSTVEVREGQTVRAGEPLLRVRVEETMLAGAPMRDRVRAALEDQDASLGVQIGLLRDAAIADRARLGDQIAGVEGEIASLAAQIADQQRLVATATTELDTVADVAQRGFISRRDMEAREATLIARRQQLSSLEQMRTAKLSARAEAQRAIAQTAAITESQVAEVNARRAALAQRLAEIDAAEGYTLTAPSVGVVTALTARVGQRITPDQPALLVVPAGARPRVELMMPTHAAGFVRPGQEVRLAIDAFPYQRFGTLLAQVASISTAAVATPTPDGPVPAYLVVVTLPQDSIRAFGRDQPLLPGMTLTARIVTDERSLLEWLFEPVFAVRNR